ncbi:MAG: sigma-70 family RNA polymerase sigma factor [Prevotella sp.]|nr:sigma-70 family RNA polymerase sigma factor [Prevotella sp.]
MNNKLITNYYITHRDELLAYASSRLGDSRLAEDIVQDVFLRLLSSDKMISEITLPALVYTIIRNLINDYYRRHATFEQYEHFIKGVCSEQTTMESVFSAREIMERLECGLVRLPENCREIYRLHIYDGLKVGEISRELGEGYKSVEHRLGTARKLMRQYLRCYASA